MRRKSHLSWARGWCATTVLGCCAPYVVAAPAPAEPACLKCHAPIETVLKRKFKHAAVEMGCDSCHANHREAGAQKSKTAHYLNADLPELCLTCHDAKDQKIAAAHRNQPFEKANCAGCHDPHASDSPKLIPARVHAPYEARQCDGCHEAPGADRKVVLSTKTVNELCYVCHDALQKRLSLAKARHSLLDSDPGSCAGCHDPHASDEPALLRKASVALCQDCHTDVAAGKKHVHRPVESSCTYCHDAHGSNVAKNLHAGGNQLCLACHGTQAIEIMAAIEPVELFGGRVKISPGAFPELKYLDLSPDVARGHPSAGHPVAMAAASGREELSCASCHLPHAANGSRSLLVTESAASSRLCIRCHK